LDRQPRRIDGRRAASGGIDKEFDRSPTEPIMCLAIPAQVSALLPNDMARVTLEGVSKEVSIALVEGVAVGDYVVVHVGFALSKIDPEEAQQTLALLAEAAALVAADL
jgi:hydrogenase expression/formation protein HypC